jgi:queuine tRNA-ribosyltransferase
MTDSGGFQVFSLGAAFGKSLTKFVKEDGPEIEAVTVYDEDVASKHGQLAVIDDEGVSFTSHLDGSLHRFTPERSVEIQHALGADMFFAFDECTAPTEPYEYQKEAMERTHRWAERSLKAHRQNIDANKQQAIFGIAQGGQFDDLRRISAKEIGSMGFDGFGLGGSFSKKYGDHSLESALKMLAEIPPELPVHGLGVGEPGDLLLGIAHGVDLFDCVAATRIGRHGSIYTKRGIIHLTGEKYKDEYGPLDPECIIPGTEPFTRAYAAHLIRSKEMLGSLICSIHNIGFILKLVDDARQAILDGTFDVFREEFMRNYYK